MTKLFASAALLALASGAQAQGLVEIQVAEVAPVAAYWPSFIAESQGFYAEHGVAPVVTLVGSPATSVQQLVGGSFGLASTTFDSAMRAASAGASLTWVGATTAKYTHLMMADPSITQASDLVGKTVMVAFQKDVTTSVWTEWLQAEGVDPASVDLVFDASTPNRYAALSAGQVEAAMLVQPFDFRARSEGFTEIMNLGARHGDLVWLGYAADPEWLAENGDAARGFLAAQSEAIDWFYDAANREAAVDVLVEATGAERGLAEQTYDYYAGELQPFARHLQVPEAAVGVMAERLVALGDLAGPEAVPAGFVDLSYAPAP